MEKGNQNTTVTFFVLLGLLNDSAVNIFLLILFLFIYVLTLLENLAIMAVTTHLSSPMYFFLAHLAFLDICFSSVTVPKLLDIFTGKQIISYNGCFIQMFFIFLTGGAEIFLLSAMAYDRYAAICNPLQYVQIMNKILCRWLVSGSWAMAFLYATVITLPAWKLCFCKQNVIRDFSCEFPSILALSCTETFPSWMVFLTLAGAIVITSLTIIIFSYTHIISTILKLNSVEAKRKTFSTCSAHLIVVVLYYGTGCFRYMRPSSASSIIVDELFSIQYSISTPMLNPLIYSLKNKEVKETIRKLIGFKPLISCTV